MRKIKEHILKNKNLFFVYVCITCILIIASIIMYKTDIQEAMLQPRNVVTVKEELGIPSQFVTLTNGTKIEQRITMVSDEFTGFSLWLEKNKTEESAELSVQLRNETGRLIEKWKFNTEDIVGNEFFNFHFSPINVNVGDIYTIIIEADSEEKIAVPMGIVKVDSNRKNILLSEMKINNSIGLEVAKDKFCLVYQILNGDCRALKYFYLAVILIILFLIGTAYILITMKPKKEWIFVFMSLLIGGLYILIIPPYIVPDDEAHFVTAYAESSTILGKTAKDENGNVILYPTATNSLVRKIYPDRSSYATYIRGIFDKESVVSLEEVASRGVLGTKSLAYIPQVIGLSIGRLLNVNSTWLYILGRAMALLLYCFLMFWSIRLIPEFGKNILFIVGLLPMTIQQITSYNYDSILFDASFFLISYILYLAFDEEKNYITLKDYIIVAVLILVIVPIKFIYIPILGLGLLVPKEKFGGKKKKLYIAVGAIMLCIVVIFVTRLGPVVKSVSTGPETYTLMDCIQDPIHTFVLFFRTIGHYATLYLQSMIGSPLGWFEIVVPNIIIYGFALLLFCSLLGYQESYQWKREERIGLVLLVCGVSFLILLALLQGWTLKGSKFIEGVQGRYFIPILPIFLLALKNKTIILTRKIDTFLISGVLTLQTLTAMCVISVIVNRSSF